MDDAAHISPLYRRLGHAIDDAGLLALRDSEPASVANGAHAIRSIVPHPGHDYGNRVRSILFRHAAEKHIRRGTMTLYRRIFSEDNNVTQRQFFDLDVPIARAYQYPTC